MYELFLPQICPTGHHTRTTVFDTYAMAKEAVGNTRRGNTVRLCFCKNCYGVRGRLHPPVWGDVVTMTSNEDPPYVDGVVGRSCGMVTRDIFLDTL